MWVALEGALGAGKSTFVETILPRLDRATTTIPEPVEKWVADGVLERSYRDPTFKFPAQCYFFTSRIQTFREKYRRGKINVSERSPFSDKIFWNLNCTDDPQLHQLYMDMWKEWQNLLPVKRPDLFIYLKVSTETSIARTRERNRAAEENVDEDYLRKVVDAHDEIFTDNVEMPDGSVVPCITISGEGNFRDDPLEAERIANIINIVLRAS